MLSSASRLLLLRQTIFLRSSRILSHPRNLVLVLDAMQRLGLQPPLAERAHWTSLFEAALNALPSNTMDLSTMCKVLLTLTEMLRAESSSDDDLDFCRTSLRAMQEKIYVARNELDQFQLFDVLAAVIILANRSQVVHQPLQSFVRSKAPLFSAELFRSKHIATLVAAVSSDPREYGDEDVVAQLRNLVEKRLPQLSHQDALVIFDALTSRHQEHGRTIQHAVPTPLACLRAALYEHASAHRHEMSPSHLSAWLSRIANDVVSDILHASEQHDEVVPAKEHATLSATAVPRQFLAHVFRKLCQSSYIDALSEVAWHSTCMSVCRLWALPRAEIDFSLLGNRSQRASHEEQLKDREVRLGLRRSQCAEWLCALMSNRLTERLSRLIALECALAVPTALLAVQGITGNDLRAIVETYVDAHACSIAELSLPFTLKVLRCSINCALACISSGGDNGRRPTKTSVGIVQKVLSSTSRLEDAKPEEEVDRVTLVNELSSMLYAISGSPHLSRHMHDLVALIKPSLCTVAAHVVALCQRNDPRIDELKTGALVRFLSSLSKLGVRKQHLYASVVRVLVARQLTDFELIRVVIVASKQQLIIPSMIQQVLAQLRVILNSVQFHQKVILLESLGRLGVRWTRIQVALQTASAAEENSRGPRREVSSTVVRRAETLRPVSPPANVPADDQRRLRRPQDDKDSDKEQWIFPKPTTAPPGNGNKGVTAIAPRSTREASLSESLLDINAPPATLGSWFGKDGTLALVVGRCAPHDQLSLVHLVNAIHLVEYPISSAAANDAALRQIVSAAEQAAMAASHPSASSSRKFVFQSVVLLAQHVAAVAYLHSESRGVFFSLRYLKTLCEQLRSEVSSSQHPFQDFRQLALRWHCLTSIGVSSPPASFTASGPSRDFERLALADVVSLLQKDLVSVFVANLTGVAQSPSDSTFIIAHLRVSISICGPEVLHDLGEEYSRILVDRLVSVDLRRHMRALRARDVVDLVYLLTLDSLQPWLQRHETLVRGILRLVSDGAVPRFWNEFADSDGNFLRKSLAANGLDVDPALLETSAAWRFSLNS